MDPGELRSQIITLCKEYKLISYENLCSLTGCDSEKVRNVCDILLKENLVADVDNFGIKATKSLLAITVSEPE